MRSGGAPEAATIEQKQAVPPEANHTLRLACEQCFVGCYDAPPSICDWNSWGSGGTTRPFFAVRQEFPRCRPGNTAADPHIASLCRRLSSRRAAIVTSITGQLLQGHCVSRRATHIAQVAVFNPPPSETLSFRHHHVRTGYQDQLVVPANGTQITRKL